MSQPATRRLGRGLTSLLNSTVQVSGNQPQTASATGTSVQQASEDNSTPISAGDAVHQIVQIGLTGIIPNRNQPRKHFDPSSLERLAESIRSAGVMQPILVRSAGPSGQHEIVAGERRFRAAALAGLRSIPAIIVEIDDEGSAEWALIENMQRDDLAPMEKAWALRALAEKFGLTHHQIAEKVGLDRSSVTNTIRLTELEPEIVALLDQRRLTLGHGKALLSCLSGPRRVELARRAAEEDWSVRKLERACATVGGIAEQSARAETSTSDPARRQRALESEAGVRDLEQQLSEYLGTKVELSVSARGDKGRVSVSFYGLDHFDSLMAKIGFTSR